MLKQTLRMLEGEVGPAPLVAGAVTGPGINGLIVKIGENITLTATSPNTDLTRVDWIVRPYLGGAETIIGTQAGAGPYSQAYVVAVAQGVYEYFARSVRGTTSVDSPSRILGVIDPTNVLFLLDASTGSSDDRSNGANAKTIEGSAGSFGLTFNGFNALTMVTGQALTYTGTAQAYYSGVQDVPYTLVMLYRPITVSSNQNLIGWSRSTGGASDKGANLRTVGGNRHHSSLLRDDANLSTTINDTLNTWFRAPQLMIYRQTGTQGAFNHNGGSGALQAQNRGVLTSEFFNVWCFRANSGLNATGNGEAVCGCAYDQDISAANEGFWRLYASALGLNISGLTAVDEITGALGGQSNGEGPAGTIDPTPGVVSYDLDSFKRKAPSSANNGGVDATFPGLFPLAGPHKALGLFIAEALIRVHGRNQAGIISCCRGGSTATDWAFGTTNPPATLTAALLLYIQFAQQNAGVFIANKRYTVIYQGEADSAVEANALAWAGKWTAWATSYQLLFPDSPIIWVDLSATNPDPINFPFWQTTRAGIASMAQPANNWWVIQAPDCPNPPDVHLGEPELRTLGYNIADLVNILIP
jgi:hypothetical protein